jgi:hypothetical protein
MKARSQETFAKRWTGCVEIKTGEAVAKLTSIQTAGKDGAIKKFPGDVESIKIKLEDFPKAARRLIKPNMESKKFRVRLDEDGLAVETVTPYSGVYRGRATGLAPKNRDGEFTLLHKVYNEGKENENKHEEFIAVYEITDGVYRGVELPGFYLHYKFEEDPENEGFTRFNTVNTPQASQLHKLISWAEVHSKHGSILDEDVRWKSEDDGTILEELEERVLENDREVNLVFEKGYIKLVQPVEDYEEVEDEDDAEDIEEVQEIIPVHIKKELAKKFVEKVVHPEDDEPEFLKEEVKPVKGVGKKAPAKKSAKMVAVAEDEDDL